LDEGQADGKGFIPVHRTTLLEFPGSILGLTATHWLGCSLDKAKPDTGNTTGLNLAAVMFTTVLSSERAPHRNETATFRQEAIFQSWLDTKTD
jgi:hypothetical protein